MSDEDFLGVRRTLLFRLEHPVPHAGCLSLTGVGRGLKAAVGWLRSLQSARAGEGGVKPGGQGAGEKEWGGRRSGDNPEQRHTGHNEGAKGEEGGWRNEEGRATRDERGGK